MLAVVVHGQDVANSARSNVNVTTQQTLPEQQLLPEGRDQNWGKRRAEGEEEQEEEKEEINILAYPPPEALTQFPNPTPETIRMVIQTALENTTQQLRIEKEKAEKAAARRDADSRRAEAENVKGKGKATADRPELTTPSIQVIDAVSTTSEPGTAAITGDDGSLKSPGRPRFGLRRIFHHLVERGETNGESSVAGSVDAQNHSVSSNAGSVVEAPSPFTQFIYKHMPAKLTQTSDQGSEEK